MNDYEALHKERISPRRHGEHGGNKRDVDTLIYIGLLMNFNTVLMKDGITRMVL